MKHVPHWQLLMLIYIVLVAVPVLIVHSRVKKKVLDNKTVLNLLIYFISVVGTAFLMHFITMFLYFKLLFSHKP